MRLVGAEHQGLFALVDLPHENLDPLFLALADFDDLVEILFLVALARFDLAFDQRVVRRINVFIHRRGDLLDAERRQEAVVDALAQRIHKHRVAEVGIGIDVVAALGCRGQAELHRGCEVFQDAAPVAFIIGAAAMALVNDDEIKKIRWIFPEVRRRMPFLGWAAHKCLEDGEENTAVLRHAPLLADVIRRDAHQ